MIIMTIEILLKLCYNIKIQMPFSFILPKGKIL